MIWNLPQIRAVRRVMFWHNYQGLGKKNAFLGKVGHDQFGSFLENTLICHNINTDGVVATDEAFTTLAFVGLDSQGNRSFSFVRNNSADVLLSKDEVRYDIIAEGKIFHCGSLSLTHSCSAAATVSALEFCRFARTPNIRRPHIRLKHFGKIRTMLQRRLTICLKWRI